MENDLRTLLKKHNLSLKKAYGQNFLTDQGLLLDIVEKAGVTKDDVVLEIGVGAGALTRVLATKAKKVFGYEIDTTLKPLLADTLKDFSNVDITFKDIMRERVSDIEKRIGGEYIIVANLPYYITTPIIMQFLDYATKLKAMVIMVQEEVAERLAAKEKTSDYGAITVAINLKGKASIIKRVGREMFTPPPNVDSAVVKIDVEKDKFLGSDLKVIRDIVRCGFSSRRKMLINNLMKGFKFTRQQAEELLTKCGLSLTCRAEELSAEDYVKLSQQLRG